MEPGRLVMLWPTPFCAPGSFGILLTSVLGQAAAGLWAQLCASAECKYESLSLSEPGLPVREAKVKCAIEFGYGTAGQGGVGMWGGKSLRVQWGHRGVPETCRRAGASK